MRKRKVNTDYENLARHRGFDWTGTLPKSTHKKTMWTCSRGHIWRACYHDINKGSSCPACSCKALKKAGNYHALAKQRMFKWIGEIPSNIHEPTTWECSSGHRWNARYNGIRQGKGCPHYASYVNGAKASAPQLRIAREIGGTVNHKHGGKFIDIAFPTKKIGIEYDCWYWHGSKVEEDRERIDTLLEDGWKMIIIKTNSIIPPTDEIERAIRGLRYCSLITIQTDDWGDGACRV